MNRFLILVFLVVLGSKSWAQYDAFKFNFDLTFGYVKYTYDEVENAPHSYSNMSWSDTVHSLIYDHQQYRYTGVNAVFHAGLHIPVFKRERVSFGFKPKAGIGRLIQVSPSVSSIGYGEVDSKRISSMTYDAELYVYLRFNHQPVLEMDLFTTLFGGYRLLRSNDNYYTPVVGFEFGQKYWAFSVYAHLTQMNYYRQYSDGSTEVAKKFYEFGMKANLFFGVRKKEKE